MKILITKKDSTATHVLNLDRADSVRCARRFDKSQELEIHYGSHSNGPFSSRDYDFFYIEVNGIGEADQVAAEPSRIAELYLGED